MSNATQEHNVNIARRALNKAIVADNSAVQATIQSYQCALILDMMYPVRDGILPSKNLKERFRCGVLRFLGVDPTLLPVCSYRAAEKIAKDKVHEILQKAELDGKLQQDGKKNG